MTGLKLLNLPFWITGKTISFWNQSHLVLGHKHQSWPQYRQTKASQVFYVLITED